MSGFQAEKEGVEMGDLKGSPPFGRMELSSRLCRKGASSLIWSGLNPAPVSSCASLLVLPSQVPPPHFAPFHFPPKVAGEVGAGSEPEQHPSAGRSPAASFSLRCCLPAGCRVLQGHLLLHQ